MIVETTTISVARPAKEEAKTRNHTADALRGIAALAVCWYHSWESSLPSRREVTKLGESWLGWRRGVLRDLWLRDDGSHSR